MPVLDNAILAMDANPGYAAFDDDGRQVGIREKAQEKETKKKEGEISLPLSPSVSPSRI